MAIFHPANSGTSSSNYNPRNTSMYSCGYNFRLPPLKVRDHRLDLVKTISFSDNLLVRIFTGVIQFFIDIYVLNILNIFRKWFSIIKPLKFIEQFNGNYRLMEVIIIG